MTENGLFTETKFTRAVLSIKATVSIMALPLYFTLLVSVFVFVFVFVFVLFFVFVFVFSFALYFVFLCHSLLAS